MSPLVEQLDLWGSDACVLQDLEGHLELVGRHVPPRVHHHRLAEALGGTQFTRPYSLSQLASDLVFKYLKFGHSVVSLYLPSEES
jgi:hypothetical protein